MKHQRINDPFALCLFLLLLTLSATAQVPAHEPKAVTTDKNAAATEALRKELLANIPALRNEVNQLRLFAQVATLSWKSDEKQARALFQQAQEQLLKAIAAAAKSNEDEHNTGMSSLHFLREQFIQQVAQHDARLAWDFLLASRAKIVTEKPPPNGLDIERSEKGLEAGIIPSLAQSDPQFALPFGLKQLRENPAADLTGTIAAMMPKDKEAAAQLTRAMLKNLTTTTPEQFRQQYWLAQRLFETVAPSMEQQAALKTPSVQLDEALLREVAEGLGQVALQFLEHSAQSKRGGEPFLSLDIVTLPARLEKYAPTYARRVQAKQTAWLREASAEERKTFESLQQQKASSDRMWTALASNESVDSLLATAQKASGEEAEYLEMAAMIKALSDEDEKSDGQLLTMLFGNELPPDTPTEKKDEAMTALLRQKLAQASTNSEKSFLLLRLAEQEWAQGKQEAALERCDELRSLLGQRMSTKTELDAQLRLARSYAKIKPTRGGALLEQITERINELFDAMEALNTFESAYQFQRAELLLPPDLDVRPLKDILEPYVAALKTLATRDLQQAQAITARLRRPEVRLLITLALMQSLSPQHQ